MTDIKYFCLHHTPLVERREFLLERFATLKLDVEWVTGFMPDNLVIPKTAKFRSIGEYSLYLKHRYCFEEQIKNNIKYAVIIEDDALLPDDFNEHLKICLKELEEIKGDLLFLGICCGITPSNITPDKRVYWEPGFLTRCTHCYITTQKAANTLLKHFNTEEMATDFKINDIIRKENLKSCYGEPGIHQGSQGGKFKPTLNY